MPDTTVVSTEGITYNQETGTVRLNDKTLFVFNPDVDQVDRDKVVEAVKRIDFSRFVNVMVQVSGMQVTFSGTTYVDVEVDSFQVPAGLTDEDISSHLCGDNNFRYQVELRAEDALDLGYNVDYVNIEDIVFDVDNLEVEVEDNGDDS